MTLGQVIPPLPWTTANDIIAYLASGPSRIAQPTDRGYSLTLMPDGSLGWFRAPQYNLAEKIDLTTGSDHSAALKTIIDANGAGWDYVLAPGRTLKLPLQLASHAAGTGIPSLPTKARLIGGGRNSVIQVTGWETVANSSNYAALEVYGASKEDAAIEDIAFVGDWSTRDSGPGTWTNKQPAAVWIYGTAATLKRTALRRCYFGYHWGFPVHATGAEVETVMEDCTVEWCGNGANINSNYFKSARNRFYKSEGFECSGAGITLTDDIFLDMVATAISIGGNVGTDSFPGGRISRPIILTAAGVGILTAESCGDVLIDGAYVYRATDVGIDLNGGSSTTGYTDRNGVANSTVISTQVGGTAIGVRVNSRCAKAKLANNQTYNDASYDTMLYGVSIDAADVRAVGNDFRGKNCAAKFGSSCSNVFWDESNSAIAGGTGIYDINAAATFAPGSVLQIAIPSSFWKPTAAARFRGVTINYAAANGAADYKQICVKDAADSYAWRDLF